MKIVSEFKKFALRGNFIDLAIGFTVGAAFSTIAKSFVSDIVMPPVGLLLGRADFSDLFWLLKAGVENPPPYATLADAQSAGAVTINYGLFINNILAFVVVAAAMFIVVFMINKVDESLEEEFGSDKQQPEDPLTKKCPFCRSVIPFKAVRCPNCTSHLESDSAAEAA